jgi:hypothetical protein
LANQQAKIANLSKIPAVLAKDFKPVTGIIKLADVLDLHR